MSKELTFSSATLGWRFSHTDTFLRHFIKQWELLQDVQIKNLDEYWNVNGASGEWLRQVASIFHVTKNETLSGNQFVLDIDQLDDEEVFLDGTTTEMADSLFRAMILYRSAATMKLFSMKNIAETLKLAFGKDNIKVEFRENSDRFGNYKPQYFRIIITFKDSDMAKLFVGLQETHPLVFIGKPMGISYDIFCIWDETLGA